MKKELSILRSKEDGTLCLPQKADLGSYEYITIEDFIETVESSDRWDDIEADVYRKALEEVGLEYDSYDDPDFMWDDFLKVAKCGQVQKEIKDT